MLKLVYVLFLCVLLNSCTAWWAVDGPSGRSCSTYCNTWSSDGETCVDWAENASDACVGKYTTVYNCCTQIGSCPTGPIAKGFQCVCNGIDAYGFPFRAVGVGCK